MGATYFKFDNWNEITSSYSRQQIWEANKAFLREQLKAGKRFLTSHNPDPNVATGAFLREVEYLRSLGYDFRPVGNMWEMYKLP